MAALRFVCLLLVSICYVQSNPFNLNAGDTVDYRLPKSVLPDNYALTLSLNEDIFLFNQFGGEVTISVTVKEDKVNSIKLHASNYLNIITTKLQNSKAKEIPLISSDYDSRTEILVLNYNKLTKDASYTLYIKFTGRLGTDDMYGFYQSNYSNGKQIEHLASTQFEPVYARRTFPCFDEPGFKATFDIEVQYPAGMQFISNTPEVVPPDDLGKAQTVKFQTTPKMSTYLVAFLMSTFTFTANTLGETTVRLHSRVGTETKRQVALQDAPLFLNNLGTYFGLKYSDLGIEKMDIVAVPDFSPGAMENWGLVTFREQNLLDDGADTSNVMKQQISSVVAHEFVHQWFGDFVTLDWWSDVWLNEGFATFFAMEAVKQVHPEFEMEKQFATSTLQSAFEADALQSSLPLSSNTSDINTPAEAFSKFGLISYNKGASILQMMKHFLTEPVFKAGLQEYLSTNKNGNVDVATLLASFTIDQTKFPVAFDKIMKDWTQHASYPVVTVSYTKAKLTLTQAGYVAAGTSASIWNIPITYTLKSDEIKFTDTTTKQWLISKKQSFDLTLQKGEWIILNNQRVGYYRVTYSEDLLNRILADLTKDPNQIDVLSRAELIDDSFSVAKIGLLPYKNAFDLSAYLAKESNYHVWTSAFNSYEYLLQRTGASTPLGKAIAGKLKSSMTALLNAVPIGTDFSGSHINSLNQAQAHQWACKLDNAATIKKTKEMFKAYKTTTTKVKPDLRNTVYCCAIRNMDNPKKGETSDWDFLWSTYSKASAAEQNVILNSLGCTKDPKILQQYLGKSIDVNSGIRKQDASKVFHAVYSSNPEGVDIALNFLKDNFQAINNYYKDLQAVSNVIDGLAATFTTQQQIDELKSIINANGVSDEYKSATQQAIEKATDNLQWLQKFEKELDGIFNIVPDDNGAGSIKFGVTFIITTIITLYTLL